MSKHKSHLYEVQYDELIEVDREAAMQIFSGTEINRTGDFTIDLDDFVGILQRNPPTPETRPIINKIRKILLDEQPHTFNVF